jgi:Rad3-related DNA helicase
MPASQGPAAAADVPAHLQPVTLQIRGIHINFPFKPYASQLAMMDRVVQALKHSQNVLLELPTGSGKSLSLLCAACAWQEGEAKVLRQAQEKILLQKDGCEIKDGKGPKEGKPPKAPKVYICSRTHAQLEQLVRELRKTPYSPRMCVLGSREQYCINEDVCRPGTGKSKSEGCKEKLEENKCGHFHGVQRLAAHPKLQQPHDIEDMVSLNPEP